jgi:hypothetical protein
MKLLMDNTFILYELSAFFCCSDNPSHYLYVGTAFVLSIVTSK